jgi:hypothetical protein
MWLYNVSSNTIRWDIELQEDRDMSLVVAAVEKEYANV